MSEVTEFLENAEHASHAGHEHGHAGGDPKVPAKLIGLTMALIGVLIAFCAAMVGGERNELTRSMIEQTQATSDATSASIKFRLIMLDLEQLRGTSAPGGAAASPTLPRFLSLYKDYATERKLSKAWADSYSPLVDTHFKSAEGYEHAQLIAEIGIVLASLGVLLGSRTAWLISIAFAVVCILQLGRVYVETRHEVQQAELTVKHGEEGYAELRKAHSTSGEDEKTVEALDPGGKVRATLGKESKEGNDLKEAKPIAEHSSAVEAPAH